ncbi:Protein tyrosine phosphatase [Pedobacter sp. BAL39]|uniref:low molecular weight protein-tyrosine-phosphatase n=1 Tax=Pedobacter sp. BAL39 TaxID=391596 RepID=UPI0001559604|nr:low molecular weight protein-tyrosine-phosphatase [Pedobacter sp. BAL39]EDM37544.1 Protein tyrosine phosphatase [Pedobacter sp. BAL39]
MKILMVCLGNICRSPLAEGVMRQLVAEAGLDWQVASAGTGNWHVSQPADKRSIAVARDFGYDISKQRAQQFNQEMFESFDHILVMDRNNLRDVLRISDHPEYRRKVMLFLPDELEVTDPYFDDQLFEPVFMQIEERCRQLIEEIKAKSEL